MSSSTLMANLIAYSLQIALMVGAGTFLVLLLRVRHPEALLKYWQLLLMTCLLLPALEPWQKPIAQNVLAISSSGSGRVETTLGPLSDGREHLLTSKVVVGALAVGAGFRFLWLAIGFLRLRHYRRQAHLLSPLPLTVKEMQQKMGVNARVCLLEELHGPVTFGLRRPVLLLPASFLKMDAPLQKAVVCHELWHIRRNDWIFNLLEEIASTPFWFHPAIWWLRDRIRLSREQVVDQLVLKTTQQRKAYLNALLQTALTRRQPRFTPAPLFLTQHHLTQRVTLILKEVSMSKIRLTASLAVASLVVCLAGVASVKMFPLESAAASETRSAESQADDNASQDTLVVSSEVLAGNLVHKVQPIYPSDAKQQGMQGEVLLEVSINESGDVENMRVTKGHPVLVLSALAAVKQWKYKPYLLNGAAVPVTSTVAVNFTLDDSPAGPGEQKQTPLIRLNSDKMATKVIYQVEPIYPLEAKEKGVEGEVVFEVTINEQGEVSDVQVRSGNAMLISAAYDAVRQWRYTPVLLNGAPIRAKSTVTVRFTLEKDKASKHPGGSFGNLKSPTDVTPEEQARRRVYADEMFATPEKRGSQTDRGRVYLAWGPPDQIDSHPAGTPPLEYWRYRNPAGKPNQDPIDFEFVGADYKLLRRTGSAQ
ncbi:MAG: TonB family protein [Terriglobia bacterium]